MTELIKGNIKIEWIDLGEGWDGEWDPNDPEDQALLRFNASRRIASADGAELWDDIPGASYCTRVPADTPEDVQTRLLEFLMEKIYEPILQGQYIKKLCRELSWIEPNGLWRTAHDAVIPDKDFSKIATELILRGFSDKVVFDQLKVAYGFGSRTPALLVGVLRTVLKDEGVFIQRNGDKIPPGAGKH
jgi:hypothetical protein